MKFGDGQKRMLRRRQTSARICDETLILMVAWLEPPISESNSLHYPSSFITGQTFSDGKGQLVNGNAGARTSGKRISH